MTSKEAKKYLAGHMGYIKIANTYNLEQKLFCIYKWSNKYTNSYNYKYHRNYEIIYNYSSINF